MYTYTASRYSGNGQRSTNVSPCLVLSPLLLLMKHNGNETDGPTMRFLLFSDASTGFLGYLYWHDQQGASLMPLQL